MPSYSLRRFSNPKTLQSVAPSVLWKFLDPHRDYIEDRGFTWPECAESANEFDHLKLASILMNPDKNTPAELVDALFFTHEMGVERYMDDLLDLAEKVELAVPQESTPMDVAMQIWLRDRYALEKKHSECQILRTRTFEHYEADGPLSFVESDDAARAEMEAALDEWFVKHRRGGNSKVFVYPGKGEVWFLIRHGDNFKRESAVEGYSSKGIFFRPEQFDIVCYVPSLGELRVHAKTKGEKTLYRREFGRLIAGDPGHFPGTDKYTLEPLIRDGEKSLFCNDVDSIEWVMLTELRIRRRAVHFEYRLTFSGTNVFAALRAHHEELRANDVLEKARFLVKFKEEAKARPITMTPPNTVQTARDSDANPVETLLRKRGFIRNEDMDGESKSEEVLVSV